MKNRGILLYFLSFLFVAGFFSCKEDDPSGVQISVTPFAKTIDENPADGASLGTLEATTSQGTIAYSLTEPNPAGALAIDSQIGELTVADASLFDFETNPVISATGTATAEGVSNLSSITITLTDVNEDGAIVADFSATIDENPAVGKVLGTVQVSSTESVSLALASQVPAGAISINANTGELTVADSSKFDFETNPTSTAQVVATTSTQTDTATVTITLTDVEEVSISASDFAVTIDEHPNEGQVLGQVEATTTGTVAFAIASQSPEGAITIDAASGELTVADSSKFDFESNFTLTAQVVATVGTASDTTQVTITLTDIDEAITVADFSVTIDENPTADQVLGTVQATGFGNLSFKLTSQTPAGAIAINATTGELTVAQASAFDYETNTSLTADYEVTNGADTKTAKVTVMLNDVTEVVADPDAFITTWEVTASDLSITIPILARLNFSFNYTVDWGDGETSRGQTAAATHIYSTADTYTVKITGTFPALSFNNSSDNTKIKTVEQWGNIDWQYMRGAFNGCEDLKITATDAPDLDDINDLTDMFRGAQNLTGSIGHWEVSTITTMRSMFEGASSFNSPLNDWDVSNVIDMNNMFMGASSFNSPLNNWDVSNVTNMRGMFYQASTFNQPLDNWITSSVTDISFMFQEASSFNQDLPWDVSSVTQMRSTFDRASNFEGDITSWDVSNVRSFAAMFRQTPFNEDITGWVPSSATSMALMFSQNTAFSQDISGWDVSSVAEFQFMFQEASAFNHSLGGWKINSATNMSKMLDNSGLSSTNYDATLKGWAELNTVPSNVNLGADGMEYSAVGKTARNTLINNKGWTITGDTELP
ncbi:BspA family leucine-rich repeat surface protein [Tunicatimonas pelagia]|uniref:BspA family leucine-rich repeat surface protein n=1 Tax=Tunicatimonas pelagia TaxID=931531 RepID=UPI002665DA26|nr:BspA family leucine-rich repeat surface protein [Tunicatimonas pelagia]WKN45803.1 BspA family leucine-rich repeat surface protein [Tunicatimonas pelagia]